MPPVSIEVCELSSSSSELEEGEIEPLEPQTIAAADARLAAADARLALCMQALSDAISARHRAQEERSAMLLGQAPPPSPGDVLPTTRLFVVMRSSEPDVSREELMLRFAPYGARCCHVRARAAPRRAFASVHLLGSRADALAAVAALNGTAMGSPGGPVTVELAPDRQQTPCAAPRCEFAHPLLPALGDEADDAPDDAPPPAKRRARARAAAPPGAPPQPQAPPKAPPEAPPQPPAPPAPLHVLALALPGRGEPRPCGLLQPAEREAAAAAAALLLRAVGGTVRGCEVEDAAYGASLALAAEASALAAAAQPGACPPGGLLRCCARDAGEAAALAQLPRLLACRADVAGGAEVPPWRLLLQPLGEEEGAGAPAGWRAAAPAARLLLARTATVASQRAWGGLLAERRLGCALDLDETVVRAYRPEDLRALAQALAAEAAAAARRPGAAAAAAAREAALRASCAAAWLRHVDEYAREGRCAALRRFELPVQPLALGAPQPPAYAAYRVPGGLAGGLAGEALLLRVAGAPLLLCLRPGWAALRELLRARFWTAVATHGSVDYAAEAARVLDPALALLQLLRGGGEGDSAAWQQHALPRAQLPAWAAQEAAAAALPPLLGRVACYRREAAEGEDPGLIQKSASPAPAPRAHAPQASSRCAPRCPAATRSWRWTTARAGARRARLCGRRMMRRACSARPPSAPSARPRSACWSAAPRRWLPYTMRSSTRTAAAPPLRSPAAAPPSCSAAWWWRRRACTSAEPDVRAGDRGRSNEVC